MLYVVKLFGIRKCLSVSSSVSMSWLKALIVSLSQLQSPFLKVK